MNLLYKSPEVHIKYGKLTEMIDWCKGNCVGGWRYLILDGAGEEPGTYSFQFESEKDFVTFMVWRQ